MQEVVVSELKLCSIIKSLSDAMDLISETVVGHHKKVAYISLQLGEELNLSEEEKYKLVLTALIHDLGVFYLDQKFSDLSFDNIDNQHALVGYKLAEGLIPVKEIPEIIKYHHHDWDNKDKFSQMPFSSSILYLADRIAVLIEDKANILNQVSDIKKTIRDNSFRFWPDAVDKFNNLAGREAFWLDIISSSRLENYLDSFFQKFEDTINLEEMLDISILISHIIDFKSSFTATHSDGVATISTKLAQKFNFNNEAVKTMKIAGYLHDIGKMLVPTAILNKTDKLSEEEWNIMKAHTYFTYNSLATTEKLNTIKEWAAFHHEKLNGEGYPFHINENELSEGARIMAAADVFTALTESRPYREDITAEKVKKIMQDMVEERALDGKVVSVIIDNYEEFESVSHDSQKETRDYYQSFKEELSVKLG